MAQTKRKSSVDLIRQYTGRNPARLPASFKRILVKEITLLRLPVSTPKYPFEPATLPAMDSEYVQTGIYDYLFKDSDYAVIGFLFDVADPSKVSKSKLKDWLTNKCNVPHSELEKCSWPDIREFSFSGIEAEYARSQCREIKHLKGSDETAQTSHSADFRSVNWCGIRHSFTPTQAAIVKQLWDAWENGTPDVGQDTLLETAGSESKRLVDVFKDHKTYRQVIGKGNTKGSYRLIEPGGKK
ncbi:MAG: hypothetical protein ACYSWQ_13270 [Planctomycetota bacterium]|jgi:hypothetical protein